MVSDGFKTEHFAYIMYMLRGSLISFDIAVVRFFGGKIQISETGKYQVRFFKSVNGEVNGKAFLKVRERAFSGLFRIQLKCFLSQCDFTKPAAQLLLCCSGFA